MSQYPEKLDELVADIKSITDRRERAEMLIEIADRFDEVKVPPEIAVQPYDERHRAPACESEAFVWAADQPDGTVRFYFDVLNPQGLSAMAMAVIINETLAGQPLELVAGISDDIIFDIFGKEISMGKGTGLMGILTLVRRYARERLNKN
ncbi:MAG: SufE family protein [Chloroflexi bacterium]|nr:SufE family protein [Chloroflexota bacterium]